MYSEKTEVQIIFGWGIQFRSDACSCFLRKESKKLLLPSQVLHRRNIFFDGSVHGKIFGGYLMRLAYEVSDC